MEEFEPKLRPKDVSDLQLQLDAIAEFEKFEAEKHHADTALKITDPTPGKVIFKEAISEFHLGRPRHMRIKLP